MSAVVDEVVDKDAIVDNLKIAVAERLVSARNALGFTQKVLCKGIDMPLPSLKNYEGAKQIPGGEAILGFVTAGINANWLLTGEGPMLMRELQAAMDRPNPEPAKLNISALTAILEGLLKAGAPPSKAVAAAFEFYQINIDRGLITADGIGAAKENVA